MNPSELFQLSILSFFKAFETKAANLKTPQNRMELSRMHALFWEINENGGK